VTPEVAAAIRAKYHLDEPFLAQFGHWLVGALHGDFGTSIRSSVPVTQVFHDRLGVTFVLTALAALLAIGFGLPLGILAAERAGSVVDRTVVGLSVIGISAPGFAVGLLLLYALAVMLGWFPLYGTGSGSLDRLWHLALPAVALALGVGAIVLKVTRTAVMRELGEDYVAFLRSRGVKPATVRRRYLANAAVPIVTSIGLVLASLIGGSVLVETTFALPGIGVLLADSITFKDIPVVQALTLLIAAFIGVTTAVVDLATLALDPRVRTTRLAR
jgi:peptide/nickel transport system permease protein